MKLSGIRAKLNIVGGLFTLMLIILVAVVIVMNNRQKKDAFVVNLAGYERMLSQKMSKEILYLHFKDSDDFRELNRAVNLFDYNLNNLINGNKNKGIEPTKNLHVKQKLKEVKNEWIAFKQEILKAKNGIKNINGDILTLKTKTEKLLKNSEKIVSLMVKANYPSKYIDLSGRQRMLSQRMWLFSSRYLKHGGEDSLIFFKEAKKDYDKTLNDFNNDEFIKKDENIYLHVSQTLSYWLEYEKFISNLLKEEHTINFSIEYIFQNNTKLLDTMDEAVSLYTQDSENKNSHFMNIIYIVSFIAILITIYAYILTKDVILHVDDFVDKAKILASGDISTLERKDLLFEDAKEDELNVASSHIIDYVNKVNKAMKHSNDTITKAKSVADELQTLATDMEKAMQSLNIDESEKTKFNKKVSAAEDIAIESTENLIHVSKMLTKLQDTLAQMTKKSK